MFIYIILTILGIITGSILCYICLIPKLKATEKYNADIIEQNKTIELENENLRKQNIQYSTQRQELISSIDLLKTQSQQSADIFLQQNLDLAKEKLKKKQEYFQQEEESYKAAYLDFLNDSVISYIDEINQKNEEIVKLNETLSRLQSIVNAAVEANKRHQELEDKQSFYQLQLSQSDLEEIAKLRQVSEYLRDSEPLNKVIWKVYYEKPYTDLIGRVVGPGAHTGIYKITNLQNQMCYVGQAVNIADRWKQHIKRGLGAEAATRNKLYPAMLSIGVENFSFEIIEECDRASLNEREDYWQDYFKAKEFGYSIK